tara:strand:- start:893 stop:1030 length:138 start_codon:yes stop_codon:yes gene_type:complete
MNRQLVSKVREQLVTCFKNIAEIVKNNRKKKEKQLKTGLIEPPRL